MSIAVDRQGDRVPVVRASQLIKTHGMDRSVRKIGRTGSLRVADARSAGT